MRNFDFPEHLARLRRTKKDDELVEVKSWSQTPKGKDAKSFWESVSAFANTDGGYIILGLSEPDFIPVKGFDAAKAAQVVREGLNGQSRDGQKVNPIPSHAVITEMVDDAEILIISIEALDQNGPCYLTQTGIKNGSYKRVGDEDRKLNTLEIYELQHRFDRVDTSRNPVSGSSVSDLDKSMIDSVYNRLKSVGSRVLYGDADQWLTRKNICTTSGALTIAGLLALGKYPQQFFPMLYIDVAVHPGNHKAPVGTTVRFEDRVICEGNLLEMVRSAIAAIKKNLRTRRIVTGMTGHDSLEIPEEVLREALANAVLHRDYSNLALDSPISVDIYKDRVEISSPGGLPGGKSITAITDGHSIARNQTLARILMDVPWPEDSGGVLAEINGSGIPRMFNLMREAGLPVPDYDVDIARVTVKLSRHGLLEPDTNHWLSSHLGSAYSVPEGIALVMAEQLGAVSPRDLRNQTGHDSDDMRELLKGLVSRGILAEPYPDRFTISTTGDLTEAERDILETIDSSTPVTIREISNLTGKTTNAIRPILRSLIEQQLVVATAPPSSRNRAYLRN